MFEYQSEGRFFAQAPRGLTEAAAGELASLGAREIRKAHRGIHFAADAGSLYRINYSSRLVSRVLAPLAGFKCHSTKYLYQRAREIPWEEIFSEKRTFAVSSAVANSRIRHSRYAALKLKDAVADRFTELRGRRPSVDRRSPDARIHLHVENDRATVSLDTSGGSLHRRGYRAEGLEAPMQETVAAAIVHFSGWRGERPLYDPMCGSGTLLLEALMSCARIPASRLRERSGLESLPDFDRALWREIKEEADSGIRLPPQGLIAGSDYSPEAVEAAEANRRRLPGGGLVRVECRDFRDLPGMEDAVILCNPPYGVRMGRGTDLGALYRDLGDFLKRRCKGSSAFIYFGDPGLIPLVRLRPAWKKALKNGGLDGRLARFDLY